MNKRYELKKLRSANRRRESIITIGIIALAALLVTGVLIAPSFKKREVKLNPRPMADYTSMGDKAAPVKVEEFSDFQCPYCKLFATTSEQALVDKYVTTGKVQWTFVPFSFLGQESVKSAEAAYCAADQSKFWEYHDLIFESQNGENRGAFNRALFLSLAKDLNLSMDVFTKCFDDATHSQRVQDDIAYSQSKGVNGTPYFIVNGTLVDSSQLEAAIESALTAN